MSLLRRREEDLHFQVGIDFGTSSTKIAYAQLGAKGKRVRPIIFDHKLPHFPPFALPSLVAFDQRGNLQLGIEAARYLVDKPCDMGLRRIKVVVAGKYDKSFYDAATSDLFNRHLSESNVDRLLCKPEHITVLYLAYTIRSARMAIKSKFNDSKLNISFNICIPIDHIQNSKVKPVFDGIIAAAEKVELAWRDDEPNQNRLLEIAAKVYNEVRYKPLNESTRVFAVPEAVAETASYLVSLQARNGLHAVIDFGAGTTDLSIFNLQGIEIADATTYWYAARNLPRGTHQIENIIKDFLHNRLKLQVISDKEIASAFNNRKYDEETIKKIRIELYSLWRDTIPVWESAYKHKPYESEWFGTKVHIFTCGGGAKIHSVNEIFCQSWISNKIMAGSRPHPIKTLPSPEDYDTLNNCAPFDRLSLAYGLTIPQPVLGKYILPRDCPVHHRPERQNHGTPSSVRRCGCGRPAIPGDSKCLTCM